VAQLEFLPAPPDERAADNPWPEWPSVRKCDYGQVEATALQGADPRTWATDTLEVLSEEGHVSGLHVVALDWSDGKPERIEGSERTIPAQLVLVACGFTGPERSVFDALGVEMADGRRVLPVMREQGAHLTRSNDPSTPIFSAGDARNGSTLVVTAMADGLACATEAADLLGL
jgi:glutamate synthase (NADPH/NADH) small chain